VCVCGCVMWRALVVGWMQSVSLADATSGLVYTHVVLFRLFCLHTLHMSM
jgi:hypothetical protein